MPPLKHYKVRLTFYFDLLTLRFEFIYWMNGGFLSRWTFAYNAVLEEIVRRRTRMWSWQHIKEHRQMIRDYTDLWTKKLMNVALTPHQQAKINVIQSHHSLLVMGLTLVLRL